jgi:hypothetical protein
MTRFPDEPSSGGTDSANMSWAVFEPPAITCLLDHLQMNHQTLSEVHPSSGLLPGSCFNDTFGLPSTVLICQGPIIAYVRHVDLRSIEFVLTGDLPSSGRRNARPTTSSAILHRILNVDCRGKLAGCLRAELNDRLRREFGCESNTIAALVANVRKLAQSGPGAVWRKRRRPQRIDSETEEQSDEVATEVGRKGEKRYREAEAEGREVGLERVVKRRSVEEKKSEGGERMAERMAEILQDVPLLSSHSAPVDGVLHLCPTCDELRETPDCRVCPAPPPTPSDPLASLDSLANVACDLRTPRLPVKDIIGALQPRVTADQWMAMGARVEYTLRQHALGHPAQELNAAMLRDIKTIVGDRIWNSVIHSLAS